MNYYTTLMILVWMTLAILCILASENDRYSKQKKRLLRVTYILVGAAALAEWLGVQLTGNLNVSPWLLRAVKLFDYTLTPIAGGAIMAALAPLGAILGFSSANQALMIALYIAMDSFGTACNVTGDGAIAIAVQRLFTSPGRSRCGAGGSQR